MSWSSSKKCVGFLTDIIKNINKYMFFSPFLSRFLESFFKKVRSEISLVSVISYKKKDR